MDAFVPGLLVRLLVKMTVEHDILSLAFSWFHNVDDQRVLPLTLEDVPLKALNLQPLSVLIN